MKGTMRLIGILKFKWGCLSLAPIFLLQLVIAAEEATQVNLRVIFSMEPPAERIHRGPLDLKAEVGNYATKVWERLSFYDADGDGMISANEPEKGAKELLRKMQSGEFHLGCVDEFILDTGMRR